ncbi:MAG: hypothetical protein ACFB12_18270 [Leptolyngbyaceae cyanobacterium]
MQTPIPLSVDDSHSNAPTQNFNVSALIDRLCNFSDAYFDAASMNHVWR